MYDARAARTVGFPWIFLLFVVLGRRFVRLFSLWASFLSPLNPALCHGAADAHRVHARSPSTERMGTLGGCLQGSVHHCPR